MSREENIHRFEDETQRAKLISYLVMIRQRQGLTQVEVARRMGVTQATVSDFERSGQEGRDSTVSIVQRYARALDVHLRMWVEVVEPPADETEGSGTESTR
jgi:transcriptional regulator with XRE-family HTH domain